MQSASAYIMIMLMDAGVVDTEAALITAAAALTTAVESGREASVKFLLFQRRRGGAFVDGELEDVNVCSKALIVSMMRTVCPS